MFRGIIDYLNFVHESYIVKVIGKEEYEKILFKFPNHLNKTTAVKDTTSILNETRHRKYHRRISD